MGAILDTLYLDKKELAIIRSGYPDAEIFNQSHSKDGIQRYRVIIPHEQRSADSYYIFLIDKGIAMSSSNFVRRIAGDQRFVGRMGARIAEIADRNQTTGRDAGLL